VTRALDPLIGRIEASWNDLLERVMKLGPGGLMLAAPDGWTVKDHLAHVATWEHSLIGLIEGRDRLPAMGVHEPLGEDTDAINAAIQKLHAGETPEQALKYFRDSHASLMAVLEKLSEADLQKPYSHFQPADPDERRPVVNWVAGNTYEHYAEHIGWIDQLVKESSAAR
jgi:uncharacterized damage-inducible protein DinB